MLSLKEYMIKRIEANKEHFIEAFSHVYGEKYHEYIKKRINETKILICHDEIDLPQLYVFKNKIEKQIVYDKDDALASVDSAIKLRTAYDNFEKYMLKQIQKMFPTLSDKYLPRVFISAFESFSLKLGKDRQRNRRIIQDRIRYFKALGLDLGDDYSEYENNAISKKLVPNKEQKKRFKEMCEEMYKLGRNLRSLFAGNYSEIEEILTKEEYDRKEVTHKDMNGKNISYCMVNSKRGEISPVCVFNILTLVDNSELVFAHEFAHSIGLINKGKSNLCYGNKYISLNEGVEDYSIIEVYKYMLDHGYTIFRENPTLESNSIYNHILPIGKAFVERFKDDMLTIRFGTVEDLYKVVDDDFLENIDAICFTILEEVKRANAFGEFNKDYVNILQTIAINKIKEYKLNNKR